MAVVIFVMVSVTACANATREPERGAERWRGRCRATPKKKEERTAPPGVSDAAREALPRRSP
ncbi:MAG: hypothetical protein OXF79_04785 [Chloroflexi bacterium]|nr:hypothetical protein [Chloroflexota bacterium]